MTERVYTATILLGCVAACLAATLGVSADPGVPTTLAVAPAETVHAARGDGTMAYGDHVDNDDDEDAGNRAYLRFSIDEGDTVTGSLLFAAEGHHHGYGMFPDVVVTLGTIDEVDFRPGLVKFSGPGRMFDDPVHVSVRAYDKSKADRFVIACTDPDGVVVFEADGELFRGDIEITTRDGEVRR